jgi:hypothetical protein
MVEFAWGKSTVSLMIPFLGFLIDENYIRDDYDLVKKVRAGNDAVFDANIFDSSGNKNTAMFERCVKSGYKMDAANNVIIDVYVDFIFGKIASADLPICKIRDAILGVKWFGENGKPNEDNKFLDERLDPYLGADPVEVQVQMQKQAAKPQAQKAGQSRRSKKRPTMTRTMTRRQRRNKENENNENNT